MGPPWRGVGDCAPCIDRLLTSRLGTQRLCPLSHLIPAAIREQTEILCSVRYCAPQTRWQCGDICGQMGRVSRDSISEVFNRACVRQPRGSIETESGESPGRPVLETRRCNGREGRGSCTVRKPRVFRVFARKGERPSGAGQSSCSELKTPEAVGT